MPLCGGCRGREAAERSGALGEVVEGAEGICKRTSSTLRVHLGGEGGGGGEEGDAASENGGVGCGYIYIYIYMNALILPRLTHSFFPPCCLALPRLVLSFFLSVTLLPFSS